ncbi:MAG: DUF2312 domain-containing protein [Magnetococcales bacterium]|nr:DUF2312 domain-containing protein [Magnetococcales bacterium]
MDNASCASNTVNADENPIQDIDPGYLQAVVDRIERLEEEKSETATAIRDVYSEAKGNGFDPKVIREIIRLRKQDPHELDEQEAILHLYKQALGMG